MQHKKLLIGVSLAIALLVGTVSAGILTYYGRITGTVTVDQAVLLDGKAWPDSIIPETPSGAAGSSILGDVHNLVNRADKKILVNLETTLIPELDVAYPEYKLDAIVGDDCVYVALGSAITWEDFHSLSFDYFIERDDTETLWIPQINIKLMDGEDPKYYAAWHSFRTEKTGVLNERTSYTFLKDDFYFYQLPSWQILGLWKDSEWIKDPWVTPVEYYTPEETAAMKAEIWGLTFSYFWQNAGDTSVDPNTLETAQSRQIAWVGNYRLPGRTIVGIIIPPSGHISGYDAVRETVEFRMIYQFKPTATKGDYPIVTNVVPIGFWP